MAKQKKAKELYNIDNGVPKIAEIACKQISDLVDGNGLKPSDVRITEQEQEIFSFNVAVTSNFQEVLAENKIVGEQGAGDRCSSKDDMNQKIAVLKQQYLAEPHSLFLLLKYLRDLPFSGWGKKQKVALKELSKDYIYTEKCKQCNGAKKESCSKCSGKGNINCFNCKGFGLMDCLYCDGTGMLPDGSGGQKECHKCYGKRKSKCTECKGKKYLICSLCRGSKYIPCKNCGQTGCLSVQTHVEFEVFTDALIDEKLLSPPVWKLYEKVEQKGFAEGGHAKIVLLAPSEVESASQTTPVVEEQIETIAVNHEAKPTPTQQEQQHSLYYQVELPVGKAEFSIGEKRYKSDIVGYQSWLVEIDNFLDVLVKSGIKALQKMSQGPMAQQALVDKALKYRLVKQVFSRVGKMPKGRILKFLREEYPCGLSDKYAKACVTFADKAIGKITEKPRNIGMVAGIVLALSVFGAWFFVPLRKFISSIPEQQQMFVDIGLMAILSFVAYYIVRLFAKKALGQFLTVKGKQATKQALPPAGNQGIYAGFVAIVGFLAMAYFALEQPIWIAQLGL